MLVNRRETLRRSSRGYREIGFECRLEESREQFNMKSERAERMYSTYPESVTDENRASRKGECTNSQGKIGT
jgi:hypothetical protein